MEVNWIECERGLCISANRDPESWARHGEALIKRHFDEKSSFSFLLNNFAEGDFFIEHFLLCREANIHKFWALAENFWNQEGPQPEQCQEIDRKDSIYYW